MQSSLDYVFFASLFLFSAGVTGRITNPPQNTVAEVGRQVIFNCTSDTNLQNWIFSTNREEVEASTGQNIVINCVVQTGFTTNYEVDRPGGNNNKCNLMVKATAMQQAGVYTCSDTTPGISSILTVIARVASMTVSSLPEIVEGETVTMSYTVSYSTSTASSKTPTIQPVLSWTDSDGSTVTGSPSSTANSVTSNISVTAGRQDIRPYTCHINYEVKWPSPSTGLSFASNTPSSASNPPNTSTINVLYAPIISSIMTSQPVCPGKTVEITCYAAANPAPIYSWIGPDSRNYSGATIEAVMPGSYNCNASNVIRGSVRSDMEETTPKVSCWLWQLLLLWFLNPISACIFLILYKCCSQVRNDFNKRYLFLDKMLPCMNNSPEGPFKKAGWIILFIVMATFSGIQFLILTIVTHAGCISTVNGRIDGNGFSQNPGTTHKKYVRKSVDQTAVQKLPQKAKQTKQDKVSYPKSEQRQSGKSTEQDKSANPASEEQSIASHAAGTKFQKFCFALALAYMILGIILFAISVGVIYYECNRQCYKK